MSRPNRGEEYNIASGGSLTAGIQEAIDAAQVRAHAAKVIRVGTRRFRAICNCGFIGSAHGWKVLAGGDAEGHTMLSMIVIPDGVYEATSPIILPYGCHLEGGGAKR